MNIIMPKMGESITEGTIIKWHKKVGDKVKIDEIIFEISTDKVDTEIPSPTDGVLTEIKYKEGDTVAIDTVVAIIIGSNENVSADKAQSVHPQDAIKPEVPEKVVDLPEVKNLQTPPERIIENNKSVSSKNSVSIQMPKMGESIMEGTIIKWHKKIGDKIKKDETIFEISTDKVDTEVPSPTDGILGEIMVAEQETVAVGTIVAKIDTGLSASDFKNNNEKISIQSTVKPAEKINANPTADDKLAFVPEEKEVGSESLFLSPLVMNIAKKENVSSGEISSITGSGLDGRITKKDILSYIENRNESKISANEETVIAAQPKTSDSTGLSFNYGSLKSSNNANDIEIIPMDNIRQRIMQHMVNSRDTSVHVSAMLEVDMSKIYNFIRNNRDAFLKKENIKLTYMPFIARACIKGLQQFPLINSTIEGPSILRKKFINLGIAVAIEPSGLIVPNIKLANEKNLTGLAKSISDLALRARTKKLTPDDISNGTFTITNYGVFGTIFGTPIINQPEVAILGVGSIIKKPVVIEIEGADVIAIRPIMALTLSHDHRLVDGMLGGKFLKYLKETLENFDISEI